MINRNGETYTPEKGFTDWLGVVYLKNNKVYLFNEGEAIFMINTILGLNHSIFKKKKHTGHTNYRKIKLIT